MQSKRELNQNRKQRKFLGTKLDTEFKISLQGTKILAIDALRNMKTFFLNKTVRAKLKSRLFNTYIFSIFL